MKRFSISGALAVLLTGCTGSAVITDLTDNDVTVQATYANQAQVRAEADRGCAIHGRTAVPVSNRCLDSTCVTQSFLFTCSGPLQYSGEPSSAWLGMSVDDVTDHLYATSKDSPVVAITRIYSDGPAKKAGLRVGDLVESFHGVAVKNSIMLVDLNSATTVGERVPLGIRRGDTKLHLVLIAAARP